jgi:hypothetical protein
MDCILVIIILVENTVLRMKGSLKMQLIMSVRKEICFLLLIYMHT